MRQIIVGIIIVFSFGAFAWQLTKETSSSPDNTVKYRMVSTIPKSGTWYNQIFFHIYDELLSGMSEDEVLKLLPEQLKNHSVPKASYPSLGFGSMPTGHFEAPHYEKVAQDDPLYESWKELKYPDMGYTINSLQSEDFLNQFLPDANDNYRIVFLYREPVDQLISLHAHAKNLKNSKTDRDITLHDWIFNEDYLSGYIKFHHTYKYMSAKYPNQIKMISYESLVTNPSNGFREILEFMGHHVSNEEAFESAVRLSHRDVIKKMEKYSGPLAHDQTISTERHIRNGEPGKYRSLLSADELNEIEKIISDFSAPV